MSLSKGNELTQELYERLKGRWENLGKYTGEGFNTDQIKELLQKILKEYENDGGDKI